MIPIENIHLSHSQPRTRDHKKKFKNLIESIERDGLLSSIVVRAREGKKGEYELICGSRRLQAFKKLGRKEIPAMIHSLIDKDSVPVALCENIHRKNLTPLERAKAYRGMIENYKYNQPQIGRIVGCTKGQISLVLSIFKLPGNIQEAMDNGLSMHHARALLRLNDDQPTQQKVFQQVVDEDLSARRTEILVKEILQLKKYPERNEQLGEGEQEINLPGRQPVKVSAKDGKIEVRGDFLQGDISDILKEIPMRYQMKPVAMSVLKG
ncbi:Nucleoid occlusion protein [subsurface metagenome]